MNNEEEAVYKIKHVIGYLDWIEKLMWDEPSLEAIPYLTRIRKAKEELEKLLTYFEDLA